MDRNETLHKQTLDLERKFWTAMKDKNFSAAERLTDETCFLVGPEGLREVDNRSLGEALRKNPYELKGYEIDRVMTRPISDDVAIVAYKVSENIVVDGKTKRLEAFDSSVWVRRGDSWVCAMHTESLPGNSIGSH